jgi:hypothetical protein
MYLVKSPFQLLKFDFGFVSYGRLYSTLGFYLVPKIGPAFVAYHWDYISRREGKGGGGGDSFVNHWLH